MNCSMGVYVLGQCLAGIAAPSVSVDWADCFIGDGN